MVHAMGVFKCDPLYIQNASEWIRNNVYAEIDTREKVKEFEQATGIRYSNLKAIAAGSVNQSFADTYLAIAEYKHVSLDEIFGRKEFIPAPQPEPESNPEPAKDFNEYGIIDKVINAVTAMLPELIAGCVDKQLSKRESSCQTRFDFPLPEPNPDLSKKKGVM